MEIGEPFTLSMGFKCLLYLRQGIKKPYQKRDVICIRVTEFSGEAPVIGIVGGWNIPSLPLL